MSRVKNKRKDGGQLETLDDLSKAVNYNQWIFNLIEPHLGERVLELGCGTGNIIQYFSGRTVLGVDIDAVHLKIAQDKFRKQKNINFQFFDLTKGLKSFKKFKPDTIVCVNVMEHIENDRKFISECEAILPPGGKLVVFIPAMPSLFGEMDRTYGHYRRYTKSEAVQKISEKFEVEHSGYLNISGIFGWWLNGKILKRRIIPQPQLIFYDKIFKLIIFLENFMPKLIGLSIFIVGRKSHTK